MVTMAQRIEQLRTEKGLSRPALSLALGMPKTAADLDCIGAVFLRGGDDIVCPAKYGAVAVLNAVALTSCHGMGCNKLNIVTKQLLYPVHDARLYAGKVSNKRPGGKILLILLYPLQKHIGIESKYYKLRLSYQLRLCPGAAAADKSLFKGVIYTALGACNGTDLITLAAQRHGIAAAHKAQTHYEYICVFIKFSFLSHQ